MAGVHRFGDRLERRELRRRARGRARLPRRGPARSRASRRTRRRSCRSKAGASRSRWALRRRRKARPAGPAACRRRRKSARTRRAAMPDHEQITMSADGLMKAAGHRACLDGQQLGVGVRVVSHRGEPLQRAPAVVELPLGVCVRAGCARHHFDEDQQHVAVGGDQLLGQLEGVPAGVVVVDAYDDIVKTCLLLVRVRGEGPETRRRRDDESSCALRDS